VTRLNHPLPKVRRVRHPWLLPRDLMPLGHSLTTSNGWRYGWVKDALAAAFTPRAPGNALIRVATAGAQRFGGRRDPHSTVAHPGRAHTVRRGRRVSRRRRPPPRAC